MLSNLHNNITKTIIVFSILILIVIVVLTGYTQLPKNGDKVSSSTEQGVFGIVSAPAVRPPVVYEGAKLPKYPKEKPVLNDITVQIREYFGKDKKAGKIIASTKTDENGFYKFDLPKGTYFLVIVVDPDSKFYLTTTGYMDKNFLKEDMINTYQIISISQDKLIERNIVVSMALPQ